MSKYFNFGEIVAGYPTRVINEREARASAGIMFLFSYTGFMNVFLHHGDFVTDLFTFTFFIEFFVRVFINPKYAPYMVLARLFVRNQKPEYVGAPQKKFAWTIGILLASGMLYFVLMNKGCLGCNLYELITRQKAQNCPGGVCELDTPKEPIQKISFAQLAILATLVISIYIAYPYIKEKIYVYHQPTDTWTAGLSAFQNLK